MDGRLTIGEFSRACGLSAKVLRSYADVGLLVPAVVDPVSGYRYYDADQLDDAAAVVLLRRAGVAVADIARFLANPTADALDGWERSLSTEVRTRRQALADIRSRLGLASASTRGAAWVGIRPVTDRAQLCTVFDLIGRELAEPIDATDFRFHDLKTHFVADRSLMLVAVADGQAVGGALAFRNGDGWATLRMIAVVEAFRHRGVGRRLVEQVEAEARRLGVEAIGLGTEDGPRGGGRAGRTAGRTAPLAVLVQRRAPTLRRAGRAPPRPAQLGPGHGHGLPHRLHGVQGAAAGGDARHRVIPALGSPDEPPRSTGDAG